MNQSDEAAFIHREILQIILLVVVAVAAFFVTRGVAASNRDTALSDAAEWYARGQQDLSAGRPHDAVEAFRRATTRNRASQEYALALAHALETDHQDEAARALLLTLRDVQPEDIAINLEVARVAARRQDVSEAVRYYHNALYAPWPAERGEERRDVRLELVEFLLAHQQGERAASELVAATVDLPDRPEAHVRLAVLFEKAGDYHHALEQAERGLGLAPADTDALTAAGESAFNLREYTLAQSYLRRLPGAAGDVAATRTLVDLIVSDDPLAARLGAAERRRRLSMDADYVKQRLVSCAAGRAPVDDEPMLQQQLDDLTKSLGRPSTLDQDAIEAGIDVIARAAQHVVDHCATQAQEDRALVLIGQEHNGNAK